MIELKSANKYFNRHKRNEIHVINNASITFPDSGLVAILGPSGCGKTTMLNAIGGLDKLNSGSIFINGKKIAKRRSRKVDEIRNLNIGYIFQDYKLVEGMSVFDNVALSLKILGIKDKEEIKKRVMYTLEKVKMERYKNRPVGMLSGGERQRVGIARALVKNPKLLICDEPTGNLDSANSIEVMNILKSISSKYLVLLVTHEEELARFYADRIVELQDGVIINDYENKNTDALKYEFENRIYLKDYKDINTIKEDNIKLDIYRNNHEDVNIKIVLKNGNIYIKTEDGSKVEIIENNSNIELIDDHYKEIKHINLDEKTFDIEGVSSNTKLKYSSIFRLGSFISYGFKKLLDYPILKKILLGGFFISGMFIFYGVSSITATLKIEDKDFITMNRDYLTVNSKKTSIEDYLAYEELDNIDFIIPGNSLVKFGFKYDKYLQTIYGTGIIEASISDITTITSKDLIKGKMPENSQEVVLDKFVIDHVIKWTDCGQAGFTSMDDFLNHEILLSNMKPFTIVGISSLEAPNIYVNRDDFLNIISNSFDDTFEDESFARLVDYNLLLNSSVKLKKGRLPLNDYEIIVNIDNQYDMPLNKKIKYEAINKKLKVVGYYQNIKGDFIKDYLTNPKTIKYSLIKKANNLTIKTKDSDQEVMDYLHNRKINVFSSYDYDKTKYLNDRYDRVVNSLIVSGIIIAISLVEILLMIRSSFLSRIKEVGIYRAIGVKKTDIYKMFSGEIIAISTIASIPGILFMSYVLNAITQVPYVAKLFIVNPYTIILSITIVFIFNLVVGLLPVYRTIRKTPAQILSRFDVD